MTSYCGGMLGKHIISGSGRVGSGGHTWRAGRAGRRGGAAAAAGTRECAVFRLRCWSLVPLHSSQHCTLPRPDTTLPPHILNIYYSLY